MSWSWCGRGSSSLMGGGSQPEMGDSHRVGAVYQRLASWACSLTSSAHKCVGLGFPLPPCLPKTICFLPCHSLPHFSAHTQDIWSLKAPPTLYAPAGLLAARVYCGKWPWPPCTVGSPPEAGSCSETLRVPTSTALGHATISTQLSRAGPRLSHRVRMWLFPF